MLCNGSAHNLKPPLKRFRGDYQERRQAALADGRLAPEGIWNIVYYNTVLGRLNLKTGLITGHDKL